VTVTTLGSFTGANSTDTSKRIPAAISALNKALAGDLASLDYMRAQSRGSATAVGKEAFTRALAIYDANKPTPPAAPAPAPPPVAIAPPPVTIHPPALLPSPPVVIVKPPPPSTVTADGPHGMPVGFDNGGVLVNPIPIHTPVIPGVTLTGIRPGQVPVVNVGSGDGGVIAGPPAPEYSGPSSAPLAPASFGYTAPTADTKADGTPATATATAPAPSNNKIILLLAVATLLYAWIEGRRK
jgi:hypothetical protein